MIKTEFYDENYNEVEPENAQLIVQLFFDENDLVKKRIEWAPKKKSGYQRTTSQINSDVNNDYLSQNIKHQFLEIINGTRKIVDHLWAYHAQVDDPVEKSNILRILNRTYEQLRNTLSTMHYEIEKTKKGGRV